MKDALLLRKKDAKIRYLLSVFPYVFSRLILIGFSTRYCLHFSLFTILFFAHGFPLIIKDYLFNIITAPPNLSKWESIAA